MASEVREMFQLAGMVAGTISVPVVIAVLGTRERNRKAEADAETADEKQLREDVKYCRDELVRERESKAKLQLQYDELREKNVILAIDVARLRAINTLAVATVSVETVNVTVEGNGAQRNIAGGDSTVAGTGDRSVSLSASTPPEGKKE